MSSTFNEDDDWVRIELGARREWGKEFLRFLQYVMIYATKMLRKIGKT